MKKIISILLAFALVFALAACGGGNTSPPAANPSAPADKSNAPASSNTPDKTVEWVKMNLNVATPFPDDNVAHNTIHLLQEKINERMDGAIQFTIFSNGTLLAGTEIYDGVINGSADVGYWQTNYSTGRFPLCNLTEYPGVSYTCSTSASYVFRDYLEALQPAELSDVHVMMASGTGLGAIVSSTEIHSLADLAGKQVRATAVNAEVLSANGITPTSMAWPECYEGLRTGLVDGVFTHIEAACNANLFEVGPNVMITPFGSNSNIIIMNKEKYESMPAAQQELFDELCNEVFEEFGCKYIANPEYLEKMRVSLPEFETMTWLEGEALEEAMAACEPITAAYVESLNEQGLDGDGALVLLKELADKYNAEFPAADTRENWEQYR